MVPRQEWETGPFSPLNFPSFIISTRTLSKNTVSSESHLHTVVQKQRHSKLSIMDNFIVATYYVLALTCRVLHTVGFIYHSGCNARHATTHIHTQMHTCLLPVQEGMEAHTGRPRSLVKSHRIEIIQNLRFLPLRPSGFTLLPRWHYQANCGLRSHKRPRMSLTAH